MNHTTRIDAPETNVAVTGTDRWLAAPMFFVTLAYLGAGGLALHLLAEEAGGPARGVHICLLVLLVLTPLYPLELLLHWRSGGRRLGMNIAACLFPPLRLGCRDHLHGKRIWLPGLGWQEAGDDLAEHMQRCLVFPMIIVALLILPLLAFQHYSAERIQGSPLLTLAVELSGVAIWLAFAAEFIVMMSLVRNRVGYLKSHWLDLVIICLPLISFLRVLRVARVARVTRAARVFRLRGLAMRAWRGILLLQVAERLLQGSPDRRLSRLRERLAEMEREAQGLRETIARLEQEHEAESAVAGRLPADEIERRSSPLPRLRA